MLKMGYAKGSARDEERRRCSGSKSRERDSGFRRQKRASARKAMRPTGRPRAQAAKRLTRRSRGADLTADQIDLLGYAAQRIPMLNIIENIRELGQSDANEGPQLRSPRTSTRPSGNKARSAIGSVTAPGRKMLAHVNRGAAFVVFISASHGGALREPCAVSVVRDREQRRRGTSFSWSTAVSAQKSAASDRRRSPPGARARAPSPPAHKFPASRAASPSIARETASTPDRTFAQGFVIQHADNRSRLLAATELGAGSVAVVSSLSRSTIEASPACELK